MLRHFRRLAVVGLVLASPLAVAKAQTPTEIVWLGQMGQTSSDATDPLSWSPQQAPDANSRVLLTGGRNF